MGRHHHRPSRPDPATGIDARHTPDDSDTPARAPGADHAFGHGHGLGHGHGHVHAHSGPRDERPLHVRLNPRTTEWTPPRILLAALLALGAVVTAVALAVQWPAGPTPDPGHGFHESSAFGVETQEATVSREVDAACTTGAVGAVFETLPAGVEPLSSGVETCPMVLAEITSGPDAGKRTLLNDTEASGAAGAAELDAGDKVRLTAHTGADGVRTYGFQDHRRTGAVWFWLALALAGIAVVGAWRGVRALAGLAVTLGVIGVFLLPALARGGAPVPLALTACAAVLYLVLVLVHGANWKTASALGGTLLAMVVGVSVAHLSIETNDLRGLADENNLQILLYLPEVSITGLLTAGFILGTLGVLNDVTVAQAATVAELSEIDPHAGRGRLFARALTVGRDHLASTVYTLVLSYAGAALPLLVLLGVSGRGPGEILTSDIMATEVMRSVTGSLALVAAVPLTTAIATWTCARPAATRA